MTAAVRRMFLAYLTARFRFVRGVTVIRTDYDLTVYLDDASAEDALRLRRQYVKGRPLVDLEYIGAGMVRVFWPVQVRDQHVTFTDVDDINEWMHRVDDIHGLTNAELAEYTYDDTGAEHCEPWSVA